MDILFAFFLFFYMYFSLFLRISYLHSMNYLPFTLLHVLPSIAYPNFSSFYYSYLINQYFFKKLLFTVSAAHRYVDVWPSKGLWETQQWPHPQLKNGSFFLSNHPLSKSLQCKAGPGNHLSHLYWDFGRLRHVQVSNREK